MDGKGTVCDKVNLLLDLLTVFTLVMIPRIHGPNLISMDSYFPLISSEISSVYIGGQA
jgi:hypothetical protein